MRNDGEQVLMSSIEKALLFMLIITTNNEKLDLKNFIDSNLFVVETRLSSFIDNFFGKNSISSGNIECNNYN